MFSETSDMDSEPPIRAIYLCFLNLLEHSIQKGFLQHLQDIMS